MLPFRFNYGPISIVPSVRNMQFGEYVYRRPAFAVQVANRARSKNKTAHIEQTAITVKHISIAVCMKKKKTHTTHIIFSASSTVLLVHSTRCLNVLFFLFGRQITLRFTLLNLTK